MDDSLIELQSKTAFLERLLDQMNQVLYEQQKQIDKLSKQVDHLQVRLKNSGEALEMGDAPANERPPHY
jgi:SlyX protein